MKPLSAMFLLFCCRLKPFQAVVQEMFNLTADPIILLVLSVPALWAAAWIGASGAGEEP